MYISYNIFFLFGVIVKMVFIISAASVINVVVLLLTLLPSHTLTHTHTHTYAHTRTLPQFIFFN